MVDRRQKMEGSPHIVLIDRDPQELAFIEDLLVRRSYTVTTHTQIAAAQDALIHTGNPPQLIIGALHAPAAELWSLCRLLRSHDEKRYRDIPILILAPPNPEIGAEELASLLDAESALWLPVQETSLHQKVLALLNGEIERSERRALIVAQEPAPVLEEAFTGQGYAVTVTTAFSAALPLHDVTPFNLLIVDEGTADFPGDEAIESMQAQRPACVCVLWTGDPTAEQTRRRLTSARARYVRRSAGVDTLMDFCVYALRERVEVLASGAVLEGGDGRSQGAAESGDISGLELADLIDMRSLQSLMDDFYALTKIGVAVVDLKGKILVATGWQNICTRFHRAHAESAQHCLKSDTALTQNVHPGTSNLYRCKNNMWDVSTPIMLSHKHLGNIFYGQFFFDDEPPDEALFRAQARRYGFDEEAYIAALREVPRHSHETIDRIMSFYAKLAEVVSSLNYKNNLLTKTVYEKIKLYRELKESQEHLRLAMEVTDDGIWDGDVPSGRVYYSPSYWRMLGYDAAEFEGVYDDWAEHIHPEDRERVIHANVDCIENRIQTYEVEYRMKMKDGGWKWILDRGNVVARDADGRALRMIGTHLDIDERVRTLEDLRRTRARYQALIDRAMDGVVLINREGKFTYASPAARKMFGYRDGEDLDLSPDEATHPEDLPAVLTGLQRILESPGASMRMQYRFRRKDGVWRWIESNFTNLLHEPDVEAVVINFHDIQEQRETEEALRLRDQIFTHAMDLLCIAGLDGYFKVLNPAWSETLGWTQEELLAKPFIEFTHPEDREATQNASASLSNGRVIIHFENRYLCKDGSVRWLSWNSYPYPDEKIIVAVARDISEERKVAAALQESEERYRLLFNQMMEGFALHEIILDEAGDPVDYRFLEVNPAFEKLTGLKREDLIGRRVLEVLPDTEAHWIKTYGEVALSGRTLQYENFSEGIGKWFHVTAFSPRERQFAVTFTDITERKRAEEAVEKRIIALTQPLDDTAGITFDELFDRAEMQSLQEKFAEAMGVASLITHPDGTPITEPSNFCRLCGNVIRASEKGWENCMKSDAELGRVCIDGPTVRPCLSGGLWGAGAAITVGGKHLANWLIGQVRDESIQEEVIANYADEIEVDRSLLVEAFREVPSMSAERFKKIADMLYAFAQQLSDIAYQNIQQARFISERKKAEDALRISEERLRSIIENANDIVYQLTVDGVFEYVSPVWTTVLGHTMDEVIGKSYLEFVHPDDQDLTQKYLQEITLSGESRGVVDYRVKHKNGEWRWHTSNGAVLRDGQGRVAAFIGIARDITERMKNEARLHEQLEELRRWNAATLGRETRVLELKREINLLLEEAGKPPRYASARETDHD